MQNAVINLLNLIRNQIFELDIPVEVTSDVIKLAKKHGLLHLTSERYKKMQMMTAMRQGYMLQEICELFNQAGIECIPLKGAVIKIYYPEMWMRSSADVDILVHHEDMDKVVTVLGKNPIRKGSHCWEFEIDEVDCEIHYRLINNIMLPKVATVLGDGWKHAETIDGRKYILSPEAFYVYHLAHMAVHILKGGCGIRPFIDLYLINNKLNCNDEVLEKMLYDAGLLEFSKTVEQIANDWMHGIYRNSEIEQFIINGGIFGDYESGTAIGQARLGGKRIAILKRVFLSFPEMKYRFPVLEKHVWLLPFCWVKYWSSIMKSGKVKEGRKILEDNLSVSNEELVRAKRIIKGIGL